MFLCSLWEKMSQMNRHTIGWIPYIQRACAKECILWQCVRKKHTKRCVQQILVHYYNIRSHFKPKGYESFKEKRKILVKQVGKDRKEYCVYQLITTVSKTKTKTNLCIFTKAQGNTAKRQQWLALSLRNVGKLLILPLFIPSSTRGNIIFKIKTRKEQRKGKQKERNSHVKEGRNSATVQLTPPNQPIILTPPEVMQI